MPIQDIEHGVRVLVIDAHEPTRLGHALLLQRESWVERCYLAGGQERAVEFVQRFRPHVAVVDVDPGVVVPLAVPAGLRIESSTVCRSR